MVTRRFLQLYSLGDEHLETRRGARPSEAATPSSCRRRSGYEAPGGKAATRHGVRRGAYSTKGSAWRRRAGDDDRAARASFVVVAGEGEPSPLKHVEEQSSLERGGFYACAASRSGLGYAVSRRRRDRAFRSTPSRVLAVVRCSAASARLWAGPFCSSRRPSRSASHESARGARSRAGRVSWLAAHPTARRGGVSAARRARFWCILPAMRFLLFAPREGACSADGLARCGCELPCLVLAVFRMRQQIFDPGCTGQIGKFMGQMRIHGFFLWPIQITPVHRCVPRLHLHHRIARTGQKCPLRLVVGSINR